MGSIPPSARAGFSPRRSLQSCNPAILQSCNPAILQYLASAGALAVKLNLDPKLAFDRLAAIAAELIRRRLIFAEGPCLAVRRYRLRLDRIKSDNRSKRSECSGCGHSGSISMDEGMLNQRSQRRGELR